MGEKLSVLEPVPMERRMYNGLDMFLIWAGANTCIATVFTGGLIAPKLGLVSSIIIIIIASLIGGLILGLVGIVGYRYGLPTMVITRRIFGEKSSYIASLFNIIQLVGWASILLYVSAEATSTASQPIFGNNSVFSKPVTWVVIIGVLEMLYALRGIEKIVWYHRIAVISLIIVLLYEGYFIVVHLLSNVSPSIYSLNMNPTALLWGFDMVLATAVSWAPLVADYTRYSYKSGSALSGTWTGYLLTSIILYGLGALSAVIAEAYLGDPTQVAVSLGLNTVFLYFVALSAITTNLINIYSAVVSTQNIFSQAKYSVLSLVYGVIILLLSIVPVFLIKFEYFLYYIGDLFIPLTIIIIMHMFVKEEGETHYSGGLSWLIGSVLSIFMTTVYGYGASILGILSTVIIYPLFLKIVGR